MPTPIQLADIHFNERGLPVSDAFDDIYFSNQDGAAETEHVFLRGNRLPERFACWPSNRPFVIAETGFGTGLNMLLASAQFLACAPTDAQLHLISFERYPLTADQIERALSHWPQLARLRDALLLGYPALVAGVHRLQLHPRIVLDLHLGDVLETLPSWAQTCPGQVHAWFLDGFAPSKNPQMWQQPLYDAMSASAAPSCTLATFTAVGAVRRGLSQAGFAMSKTRGFGRKREMLVGHKQQLGTPTSKSANRRVAIIGGGIASACVTRLLSQHSDTTSVTVFCADAELADAASGNAQGAIYPLLQADYTPVTQFYNQAFVYALKFYQQYCPELFHQCGVLQLGFNPSMAERQHRIVTRTAYPNHFVEAVSQQQAQSLSGLKLECGGLFFPTAGWVSPKQVVDRLISDSQAQVMMRTRINAIQRSKDGTWELIGVDEVSGAPINKTFDEVVLANGADMVQFNQPNQASGNGLVIRPVGGQVSQAASCDDANGEAAQLKTVVCHKGYLTPALDGVHCLGATYTKLTPDTQLDYLTEATPLPSIAEENSENLAQNARYTPLRFDHCTGQRRGIRATTPDHLPLIGLHPHYLTTVPDHSSANVYRRNQVWVIGGLGSRGLTSAPWSAALLIDRLFQRPLAVDARIAKAIDSLRQRS